MVVVVVVVRRECDMAELARAVEFFFGKVSGSYLSEFPCKEMSEWGSARSATRAGQSWMQGVDTGRFCEANPPKSHGNLPAGVRHDPSQIQRCHLFLVTDARLADCER